MFTYRVYNYDFAYLGTVTAWYAEEAITKAKKKYRSAVAPMVEPMVK